MSKSRPFFWSGIAGLVLVTVGLLVNFAGPGPSQSLPPGFLTPIIAFEFADDSADVVTIFGPADSQEREELIRRITNSTSLDFAFLIFYGAFLLSFALIAEKQTGKRHYYLAALLAVIAPLFDVLENRQLLAIMEQLLVGETQFELAPLQWFTWVKWGSLALAFLLFAPFFRRGGAYGRCVSIIAFAPAALGVLALLMPGLLNELFAIATVLMFLLMIAFAFVYKPEMARVSKGP